MNLAGQGSFLFLSVDPAFLRFPRRRDGFAILFRLVLGCVVALVHCGSLNHFVALRAVHPQP